MILRTCLGCWGELPRFGKKRRERWPDGLDITSTTSLWSKPVHHQWGHLKDFYLFIFFLVFFSFYPSSIFLSFYSFLLFLAFLRYDFFPATLKSKWWIGRIHGELLYLFIFFLTFIFAILRQFVFYLASGAFF